MSESIPLNISNDLTLFHRAYLTEPSLEKKQKVAKDFLEKTLLPLSAEQIHVIIPLLNTEEKSDLQKSVQVLVDKTKTPHLEYLINELFH
jgi:hypothetical protein